MKSILLILIFSVFYLSAQEYTIEGKIKIHTNYSDKEGLFLDVDSTQINKKDFRISYDGEELDIVIDNDYSFDIDVGTKEISQNNLYPASIINETNGKSEVFHYYVTVCCFSRKDLEGLEKFDKTKQKLVFTFFEDGLRPKMRIIIELNKI